MQKAIYRHLTPKGGGGGRLPSAVKAAAKAAGKKVQVRPPNFVGDKVLEVDWLIALGRKKGLLERPTKRKEPRLRGSALPHRYVTYLYFENADSLQLR